jgi:hypothetical protein
LKLSGAPAADLEKFKAGMQTRVKQMARELLGPYISLVADPLAGLATREVLNHLIAKF